MGKKGKDPDKKKERKHRGGGSSVLDLKIILAGVGLAGIVFAAKLIPSVRRKYAVWRLGFDPPPDVRPRGCPWSPRNSSHEEVSIIIPYLNEEWFRIKVTMQTILYYTDLSLVAEIVWVSDGNEPGKVFGSELRAMHPKVSVYENAKNLGLIKSKMEAATRAKGSILMFLEPHIMVAHGWLEPLLNRLGEEPRALVMPAIDALDEANKYLPSVFGCWRFEWNLNLVYTNPAGEGFTSAAYPCPATSGGIYAIRKDWWDQLDFFDPELVRWGGDHVEATHKVWRCGGRIEVHPCSRVGHWFRFPDSRPYQVKVDTIVRNYKRLAEVWFDNYTEHFYKVKPEARGMDTGSLAQMRARRKKLECKDMSWYLRHVDLELRWEAERICIPGVSGPNGCGVGRLAVRGLSTTDQWLSREEFLRLRGAAAAEEEEEAQACRGGGGDGGGSC